MPRRPGVGSYGRSGAQVLDPLSDPSSGPSSCFQPAITCPVLTFAQIETAGGLADIEAICATPGLDGVYVGPGDLSLSLGLEAFADLRDAHLLEAFDRIVVVALAHEVVPGIHAPSVEGAVEMAGRGFRFVGSAGDAKLLRAAAEEAVSRVRSGLRP